MLIFSRKLLRLGVLYWQLCSLTSSILLFAFFFVQQALGRLSSHGVLDTEADTIVVSIVYISFFVVINVIILNEVIVKQR